MWARWFLGWTKWLLVRGLFGLLLQNLFGKPIYPRWQMVNLNHSLQDWCTDSFSLHLFNLQFPPNTFKQKHEFTIEGERRLEFPPDLNDLLRRQYKDLARALHPDKHRSGSNYHQKNSRRAHMLVQTAYKELKHSEHFDPKHQRHPYADSCRTFTFMDSRRAGVYGKGRERSLCDVRSLEFMPWSDWLIELLHLRSDEWLSGLGKRFGRNWGWGYRYDESGRPKKVWGGPSTTIIRMIDRCREIVVLVPKKFYKRPENLWVVAKESVVHEMNTIFEEWKEFAKHADIGDVARALDRSPVSMILFGFIGLWLFQILLSPLRELFHSLCRILQWRSSKIRDGKNENNSDESKGQDLATLNPSLPFVSTTEEALIPNRYYRNSVPPPFNGSAQVQPSSESSDTSPSIESDFEV